MDLSKTIQDLYAEKEKLERVIASLEELQRAADANSQVMGRSKRRGRKSMGSEERQEVSERMKKYWAGRRVGKKPPSTDARLANGS
jgi:seryl-tRNA synthetase